MKNIKIITFALFLVFLNACNKTECAYVPCGGSSTMPKIDLIILIDASGSMSGSSNEISNQADSAIQNALLECPSDLRVTYLAMGITTLVDARFSDTHRNYLTTLHGTGVSLAVDRTFGEETEKGANGIEDLSSLFDWREGACKAIFYISDEELNSDSPANDFTIEDRETQLAIDSANANGVTVSAHYLTYYGRGASILQNYTDLTSQTGGQLFTTDVLPPNYYTNNKVFNSLICNACSNCTINSVN